MLKKTNIILLCLLIPLSYNLGIGSSILVPIILFYLFKDFKNIYYSFIPIVVSSILFLNQYLLIILSTLLLIYLFYIIFTKVLTKNESKYSFIYIIVFLSIINISTNMILKVSIPIYILSIVLSILLYLYLERYLYKIILETDKSIETSLTSMAYLEMLLCLIGVISGATLTIYGINVGFVFCVYFSMYFGKIYKNIYSLLFGIISMLILYFIFNISEALFIPFISTIYLISNLFTIVLFNIYICVIVITNTGYDKLMLISIMAVSIVFELIQHFIIDERKNNLDLFEYIYHQIQKNTNDEILNFALFLDKFASGFKHPQEYNQRISDGIKTIVHNHCSNCPQRKECFEKYKLNLYNIFRSILLQEPNFRINYNEFSKYCPKTSNIEHTAKLLESQIKAPIESEHKSQNNIMIAQINGVSNAIKKYVIDLASKPEISYYQMMLLKKRLEIYGYQISYFEVLKLFKDDFNVKIGIEKVQFEDVKNTIKLISSNVLEQKVSVILDNVERGNIYINLVPEIKIDITYGYGALSCDGEEICGDNYLIKEINNGHFISAISDGMGKGYRAFYESDMTLKLVEDIIKLNLTSGTALEILNSFYAVQEYLEQYATLDFLEINRYNKTATFYKMGASTTYIFRNSGMIDKIYNKGLPFGIEDEINDVNYKLNDGDLILMSSDGIFENIVDETALQEYIQSIKHLPPQKIVFELLNYTINHKIKTKDDMSIIALKICEEH